MRCESAFKSCLKTFLSTTGNRYLFYPVDSSTFSNAFANGALQMLLLLLLLLLRLLLLLLLLLRATIALRAIVARRQTGR